MNARLLLAVWMFAGAGGLIAADPDGNRTRSEETSAVAAPPDVPAAVAATAADAPPVARERPRERPALWADPANAVILFRRLDRNGDGRLTPDEVEREGLFRALDRDGNGVVSAAEARAYVDARAPAATDPIEVARVPAPPPVAGEPPLKAMPEGDPARDAAGRGQLFESIHVPGLTDLPAGMNGVAIADLDRDGRLDIVATFSPPRGRDTGSAWGEGELLRVFLNEGRFAFRAHAVTLLDSKVSPESFGRGQVPTLADFNGDGFLDLFVTRHAQMTGGQSNPRDQKLGNSLFLSEGAWHTLRDVSAAMGIRNETAYNRQPSLGDVNRDGWLDIAIGCDNIGNAMGGFPHSRLYVFRPNGADFADGRFEDIGGSDLVPDFGGFHHDSTKDRAGPDINLRDLDNDGDLDLVQACHVDIRDPALPYSPVEYRQGVWCWRNLLAETGGLRFEKIVGNGLAVEAHLEFDPAGPTFTPVGRAPGLPYLSFADADNDGRLDVLAVGPASPDWAPRAEYVSGRFWRNLGGFCFDEATQAAGLEALNWLYRDWVRFFDAPEPQGRPGARLQPGERRPYFADAVFGDFDNDGWPDLVVLDRHEAPNLEARAILFMGRGDGAFEPKPTSFSGLDGRGICGEAADLDNDGLLDLVFAADPDNSGGGTGLARYESKVYWNTGHHGGRENHWLRVRFSGVSHAELIGARVEVTAGGRKQHRWIHSDHSYKSSGALEAHFGLGRQTTADLKVMLPGGPTLTFPGVAADKIFACDLRTPPPGQVKP